MVCKKYSPVSVFVFIIAVAVSFAAAQQVSDEGPGLEVNGLKDQVLVRRDSRSIPYIEAKNDADLYFAQGYETARDRLWQMDLLRRVARGRLAEVLGIAVLQQDMRWRRYGFASVAEESLRTMGPGLRKAVEDYSRGVNTYIATLDDKSLPVEFQILRYKPEPWKPSDSIIIGKILAEALSTTWPMDIAKLREEALPADKREELQKITNPLDVVLYGKDIVAGKEKKVNGADGTDLTASGVIAGEDELAALENIASREESLRKASLELVGMYSEGLAASNNWVIAGKRTIDGKALLANDPHLRPAAPGIWYLTELWAPGVHAAGVTFPGVPGIVLGHNENFAWGATNVGPDVQDIYFEEFNEKGEYRTPDGWKKAKVRKETITVRQGFGPKTDTVVIDVVETRNGPVFGEFGKRKYSLKWTAREPSNQEFEAFFLLNRAKDWNGFKKALSNYGGPMQNFVYADTKGNIGWYAAGKVPLRRKGDGSLPYEGKSSDGDWTGYIPFDELPHLYNPPSGFIVTANQRIVGTDYKYPELTRRIAPPWRARRIFDLISANSKISMNDVNDIQHDVFNIPLSNFAREIVRRGAASEKTLALLKGWDGRADAQSKAMPVIDEIVKCVSGKVAESNKPATPGEVIDNVLASAYVSNDAKWLPSGVGNWNDLFRSCDVKWDGDTGEVSWGKVHPAVFFHPLSAAPLIGGRFKVSFSNVGGSRGTPNVGASVSMRHISKPGRWDETRFVIPLGESGNPGSPYWKDQFDAWRTGKPEVLPFSSDAIMKAAEINLKMIPARQK